MKALIDGKTYNTDTAASLGCRYVGDFGEPSGYEEQLFITKKGKHFLYGVGGDDSPYSKPKIWPISDEEAESWKAGN